MKSTFGPLTAALLLAALGFALYLPAVHNGFIRLDDDIYIFENREVLRGLNGRTALWALSATEDAHWYPLQRLSHLLDVSLFGMRAGGHHLVSAAWHAAAAGTLFAALRLMTGFAGRSLVVAALFAVHPLQVEPVAWAAERGSVMAGFFFALTLLLWTRYVRRPGPGRYGLALFGFVLSLASKPAAAALPFLLLLLDWWPLGRFVSPADDSRRTAWARCRRLLLEKIPFLALSGAFLSVALLAHQESRALDLNLPPALRFGNAVLSCWRYVGKLLWPANLAAHYPHPGAGLPAGIAVVAALALVAFTTLLILLSRRRPWLGAGWLWFLVMLGPMLGIVQFGSHAMADRFAYLAAPGFILALVWALSEGLPASKRGAAPLTAGVAAILVLLGLATSRYLHVWRDSETLFRHTLAVTSDNWMIRNNLGNLLQESNRVVEAVGHYREALRIRPEYGDAHQNLGIALATLNRFDEALPHFREAVRSKPGNPAPYSILAGLLSDLGRNEEAIALCNAALKLQPDYPPAHNSLGIALARTSRLDEAAFHFREALRLSPGRPDYLANLALVDPGFSGKARPSPAAPGK